MAVRLAAVCVLILCVPLILRAQTTFSPNFNIRNTTQDQFGGVATSTGFSSVLSGGQTITGESTSTNFVLSMGILYYDSSAPKSQNWRWYDDELNETPTSALASENTAPIDIGEQSVIKLRITVLESSQYSVQNAKFRLQFSTASDFTGGGTNVFEEGSCNGSSAWCYADGGGADNGVITTGILSDSDSCVASVGDGCGTHNESGTSISSYTQAASSTTEYEFTIQQSGASVNTVYFFRLVDTASSTTVPVNTGETFPSLVTGGSLLEFMIEGLESGTSTEGVTTSVETTATAIPFGALALDTSVNAAQRLTVSTNGTQGYKIYAFQRQELLNGIGLPINAVLGTNASPTGWASGCGALAAGCYGYHAGEDVLEGGSTRFAADDTFAQLTASPLEVAYNSGPINDKSTDIVYRVYVRNTQENGNYSSDIVYIVTPIF